MKKIISIVAFCLLLPSLCFAGFGYGPVIVGGGVAAVGGSCTMGSSTELYHPVTQGGSSGSAMPWRGQKFTTTGTKTVTGYKVVQCESSGANTGNGKAYLLADNSGQPNYSGGAITGSTITMAASAMQDCGSGRQDTYELSNPFSLSAGTYWIVVESENSANISVYYATSTGDSAAYINTVPADPWTISTDVAYDMELWGCN